MDTQLNLQPLEHADILYSMGICFMKTGDFPQALKKLLETKQLLENHVPSYDCFVKKFARLLDSLAWIYLRSNDNFNALVMWKGAIDIRTSFLIK